MNPLVEILSRFPQQRVVVVGDAMLDVYVDGTAGRLCREAPVPVVEVRSRMVCPGGAANAAANASALGADVTLVAPVGDDATADELETEIERLGVRSALVRAPSRRTRALRRVAASSQLVVRFDEGSTGPVDNPTGTAMMRALEHEGAGADVVIISDYGHGAFTPGVIDALRAWRVGTDAVVVVDSRHPATFQGVQPNVAKPNWSEAVELLGCGKLDGVTERADGIATHAHYLLEVTGAEIVAVTLDSEGAVVFERGRPPHRTFARPRAHVDVAGAGDTFLAAFAISLSAGAATTAAAEIASAAALQVVEKGGTATCSLAELTLSVANSDKVVDSLEAMTELVACHRHEGRRIVVTNGCFDLLHRGHVTFLNRAKTLGDVLIVGINDDDSVRRLKGESRPINRLEDRIAVLAGLSAVDHIVPFAGDSADELLARVRPDVYVKGGDYSEERIPEAAVVHGIGGVVRVLPFMEDRSTTGIIQRIRSANRVDAR